MKGCAGSPGSTVIKLRRSKFKHLKFTIVRISLIQGGENSQQEAITQDGQGSSTGRDLTKKKITERKVEKKVYLFSVLPTILPPVKFKGYWTLVHITVTAVFKEETIVVY